MAARLHRRHAIDRHSPSLLRCFEQLLMSALLMLAVAGAAPAVMDEVHGLLWRLNEVLLLLP